MFNDDAFREFEIAVAKLRSRDAGEKQSAKSVICDLLIKYGDVWLLAIKQMNADEEKYQPILDHISELQANIQTRNAALEQCELDKRALSEELEQERARTSEFRSSDARDR